MRQLRRSVSVGVGAVFGTVLDATLVALAIGAPVYFARVMLKSSARSQTSTIDEAAILLARSACGPHLGRQVLLPLQPACLVDRITTYSDGEWRTVHRHDFEERFFEICESHRAQGRALAFGFILFDRSHPYVRRALAQKEYWDALDNRAGRYLTVFSFDVHAPQTQEAEFRFLHRVEAPPIGRHESRLAELFGEDVRRQRPCVIFFQVEGGSLLDAVAVTVRAKGLTETYEELLELIGVAADSVSQVEDANAENAAEVFNLVRRGLRDHAEARVIIRLFGLLKPIATIGSAAEFIRLVLG